MIRRAANLLKFRVERFLLRGATFRLLFIAAVIGLLAGGGGLLVQAGTHDFQTPGEAIWWAFLRLTDPGYLGDDQGTMRRVVSTFLTVAGYVVFLGALVAIMTQWLNQTIRHLESGYTPIAQNDHILLVGWNTRTITVMREILQSKGRVRRFLSRHGARRLRVVLLAEEAGPELSYDLRERLGPLFDDRDVIIRSGTSLRIQHLRRVDFANASTIVVPGGDSEGPSASDSATIKTLLSMSTHGQALAVDDELPLVVAEIFDARKVHLARTAYQGPVEVLASERAISRLMAQSIRLPGMTDIYREIFTEGAGNEIYVREVPHLAGERFGDMVWRFPRAIPLGVLRRHGKSFRPLLAPGADFRLEPDDRLVSIAASYEEVSSIEMPEHPELAEMAPPRAVARETRRRILIVGWNHKVPPLLQELERYVHEEVDVVIFSAIDVAEREQILERYGKHDRATIRHEVGDRTLPDDMQALEPHRFDNLLLLGSDAADTREESDARTVTGYLVLRELLEQANARPRILVELFDRANAELFDDQPVEILASPLLVGRMLAQIALRQELRAVYDQLFGSSGPELTVRSAGAYGLSGELDFTQLQACVHGAGEILVGVGTRLGMELNPERDTSWHVDDDDTRLLVLTT